MGRRKKGYSKTVIKQRGRWYGRLRIALPDGGTRSFYRAAVNKTHARSLADKLEAEWLGRGEAAIDGETATFRDVAARFRKVKLHPPIFANNRKVAGYKQPRKIESRINRLEAYFGDMLVRDITVPVIEAYRLTLLQTPTRFNKPRSIYDVNHQLRHLRIVLNFALQSRLITENPFQGAKLIAADAESPREREERPEEVERLLAACTGRRLHLRYWILTAVETAARVSEVDRLEWQDVMLDEGVIRLRVSVTKTERQRFVPLTDRLAAALQEWRKVCETDPRWKRVAPYGADKRIFGGCRSNKTAWKSALEEAGIDNLQRKDLRHWATTRITGVLAAAGLPYKHGMAVTGHTQERTFRQYITTDLEMVRRIGKLLK